MRRTLVCVSTAACCLLLFPLTGAAQPPDSLDSLAQPLQRQLTYGETHQYQIVLASGEFVETILEQQGIDVAIEVSGPGGDRLDRVQEELRSSGAEQIDVVATQPGTYTFRIAPGNGVVTSGAYAIRVKERRPATDADRTLQTSRSLRMTASGLEEAGRFAEARPMLERALALAESVRGRDDPYVATLVFVLAGNALEMRDDARARAYYERAVATFERLGGADHPYAAMAHSRLGLLDQRSGQRQRAEAQVRQAMAVLGRVLGPDHPWSVLCMVTLANLRDEAGDHVEAEAMDRRALSIVERTHQNGTIVEASLLNNLADILRQRGEYDAAEGLFQRSLAIGERLKGPDSYFVSTALQNLGIIARERKDYAAAVENYKRALAIRERVVGPNHPDIAQILNNLAVVYHATGDDTRSIEMHLGALHIWETTAGPYHRGTLTSVGNVARTYASMGDIANAVAYQRRADAIIEMQMSLNLATGSERQKLAFVRNISERTDRTISLHLGLAPTDPAAASLAALVLLQRKGRVQDAMTDMFAAARLSVSTPADDELLEQLRETTTELARLALNPADSSGPAGGARTLAQLEGRKEQLEAALSDHSAKFRAQVQAVTLERVQMALPMDAALIEFAVYRPFDPKAERNAEAYGPARYAAYIIRRHGTPVGVDLGAIGEIDPLIARCRDALRDPLRLDARACTRALDDRIMRPLRPSVRGVARLLISPDGDLNLVPFEALIDERGRFLIERYATSYLTSGRDILRTDASRGASGPAVIVADPFFGEPTSAASGRPARPGAATPLVRRGVSGAPEVSSLYFAPLSGSAAEARAIKALLPDATLLTGRHATKASLEQLSAPRILHIASHGFFLDDVERGTQREAVSRNPLLRSGLALAGANLTGAAQGEGILTALEAAGLDLWGTRLVTLSACDTGVGEVRNGEGVYGLRRAFVLAGAETLVMSLWPVSDSLARETMVAYYERLGQGLGRGDALRQAKLAILKRPGRRHPYYWAGFIQSGVWSVLN